MDKISFGSTFQIRHNDKNLRPQGDIIEFCEDNEMSLYSRTKRVGKSDFLNGNATYETTTAIVSPDEKDNLVEAFLANKGITFNKLKTEDLMNLKSLENRVLGPQRNMKLVYVKSERLEQLASNQENNIDHCKKCYDEYYKDNVDSILKSGYNFNATTMYITSSDADVEETIDYIKTFGADRLNKGQLSFILNHGIDDHDNYIYFGLKDAGMKTIPMYVDSNTYKLGKALELFEEK